MACAGCDVHHTGRGADGIPGTRESRCEFDLGTDLHYGAMRQHPAEPPVAVAGYGPEQAGGE